MPQILGGFHVELSLRKRALSYAIKMCTKSTEELVIIAMAFINSTVNLNLAKTSNQTNRFEREHLLTILGKMFKDIARSSEMKRPLERVVVCAKKIDNLEFRLELIYNLLIEDEWNAEKASSTEFGEMLKQLQTFFKAGPEKSQIPRQIVSHLIQLFASELLEKIPKNRMIKRKKFGSVVSRRQSTRIKSELSQEHNKRSNIWDISLSPEEVSAIINECSSE